MAEIIVTLDKLTKSYYEAGKVRKVLNSVDFEFYKNEIVVMFGRSGSGKSTLLNLISGIDQPDGGDLIIDGKNLSKLNERQRTIFRRKNIGFIFQFFNLIPTLTVLENLFLPLELVGADNKQNKEYSEELLEEVGLLDRANSYPDTLSGGEQQRIAISRALVHDPPIILADEPTGNLDFTTGEIIISLLDRLVKKRNKTMIMATHSKDLIGFADRLIQMKEGKLEVMEIISN